MDFLSYRFDELSQITAIALGSLLLLQILYFIIVFGRTCYRKKKIKTNEVKYSVSVVICVKNESKNIKDKLPIILEQEYPNFEVVVVNDASQDDTGFVLDVLQKIYPILQILNLPNNVNYFYGRKFPISLGIKSSKNDIIIFTDADTIPTSYRWIEEIVKAFTPGKEIVLGYNAIESKKGILNSLIQYDNQSIAMNYLGHAILGNPYMGKGKNLAFKKELFFKNNGFISHYNIPTGEDDLFINMVSNSKNTNYVLSQDSINLSKAKTNLYDFTKLKEKLFLSQKHFKLSDRFMISLIPFTTFLIYILVGLAIYIGIPWQYVITALIIRYTTQIIVYYKSSKLLGTKKIAIFAPIYEIFFIIYNTIIRGRTLFSKGKKWN